MTTISEIEEWYDEGIKTNKKYMFVICDTFDYEDYPVFTDNINYEEGEMQEVMEVYDLTIPFERSYDRFYCDDFKNRLKK